MTASPGARAGRGHCRMEDGQPLTGFSLQERAPSFPQGALVTEGAF